MDTEKVNPVDEEPQDTGKPVTPGAQDEAAEPLITPEIEENPDLEDPRLYSPLVDPEQPDPRIAGDEDDEDTDDDAG